MKMWNSLNDTIRNVDYISKFKSELKKIDETENHAVPKHYLYGSRKMNIMLTHQRSSTVSLSSVSQIVIPNLSRYIKFQSV
jgi:hypothetical protein